MRYGLTLVPQGAFAQDVALGIQLQDEPVVVVPEECPECPPSTCEVECYGWDVSTSYANGTENQMFTSAYRTTSGVVEILREGVGTFSPQGEWCGHRTRFVVDPGNWEAGYAVTILSGADGEKTAIINFRTITDYTATGSIAFQIDLTDAEPGGETWTDICTPLAVKQGPMP